MCGRYGFTDPSRLKHRFGLLDDSQIELKPRYNITPTQVMPVIIKNGSNQIDLMRWGLIPFWAKDIRIGNKMINARAEGIAEKPAFRKPLKSQRCLVPASYFFEWLKTKEVKIPYLIKLRDEDIFSFAGLYDVVKDAEGNDLKSYTIITTESNREMAKIHSRMPVILDPDNEQDWLDKEKSVVDLLKLLKPFPEGKMEIYQVSELVNNPANDSPDLINHI